MNKQMNECIHMSIANRAFQYHYQDKGDFKRMAYQLYCCTIFIPFSFNLPRGFSSFATIWLTLICSKHSLIHVCRKHVFLLSWKKKNPKFKDQFVILEMVSLLSTDIDVFCLNCQCNCLHRLP